MAWKRLMIFRARLRDFAVLSGAAADRRDTLRPGEALLLRAVVRERQDELRREALGLGRRLDASKRCRAARRIRR